MHTLRLLVAVLVVLAAMVVTRGLRLSAFRSHQEGQRYEDVYYLPHADYLPVLSLGYRQALASLLWCRSLVYFGEELGQRGPVKYVFEYTDAILALDPSFRSAYRWIATAALYRPVAVDIEVGLRASRYLERAIARWPEDGELHWDYGSLLRFELAPLVTDKAKKKRLLEQAAPHLEAAARLGAGPPWLGVVSADLLNKLGRTEQAIRHLEEIYATVQDDQVRAEVEARLTLLRSQHHAEAMRASTQHFDEQHARSYPYLSPSLFLLVGPRPAEGGYEAFVRNGFLSEEEVRRGGLDDSEVSSR